MGDLPPVITCAVMWISKLTEDFSDSTVQSNLLFVTFLCSTQNKDISERSASECWPYKWKRGQL